MDACNDVTNEATTSEAPKFHKSPVSLRQCKDCGIQKPLDAFYKNYKKCKECVNLKIECNVCKKINK